MVVKVNEGWTYAEFRGKFRTDVNLEFSNTTVLRPQPTRNGDVLLRPCKEADEAAFTVQVQRAMESIGEARVTETRIACEIRNLDAFTEQEEPEAMLWTALDIPDARWSVKRLNPARQCPNKETDEGAQMRSVPELCT